MKGNEMKGNERNGILSKQNKRKCESRKIEVEIFILIFFPVCNR